MERNAGRNRVVPLDDLDDYQVAEGDPDIEGWEVISSDGKSIGKIKSLLADPNAMKVRYIDVDLDRDLVRNRDNSHVLIPVGQVRVIEEDKRVMSETMNSNDVLDLPAYTGGPVSREYESTLRQRFDKGYQHGSVADEDFYSSDIYDEERFYGRGVGAGNASRGETIRPSSARGGSSDASRSRSEDDMRGVTHRGEDTSRGTRGGTDEPLRGERARGETARGDTHRRDPAEGGTQRDERMRDDPLPGRSGPPPDRDRDF